MATAYLLATQNQGSTLPQISQAPLGFSFPSFSSHLCFTPFDDLTVFYPQTSSITSLDKRIIGDKKSHHPTLSNSLSSTCQYCLSAATKPFAVSAEPSRLNQQSTSAASTE